MNTKLIIMGLLGGLLSSHAAELPVNELQSKLKGKSVRLEAKTYYLTEPVKLGPGQRLDLIGVPGKTRIHGGRAFNQLSWQLVDGIWETALPAGLPIRDIRVAGIDLEPARFPNYQEGVYPFNGTTSFNEASQRAANWKKPSTGFMHALHGARWGDYHYQITEYKNNAIYLEGGWQNNRPEHRYNQNLLYVSNIAEELDAIGEFFYDAETGKLRCMLPDGLKPDAQTLVETAEIEQLVVIQGTDQKKAGGVRLRHLTFSLTVPTFMKTKEPLLRSDWMIFRGGAVFANRAENVLIENCDFEQLGGNGVFLSGNCRKIQVKSSSFRHLGASGVAFVGELDAVRQPLTNYHQSYSNQPDSTPGPQSENYPAQCGVYDSLFYRTGRIEKQSAPVQISMAMDITVSHCTIYEVPRAGINVSEGTFGGHLLEFNDVFQTVLETSDHGAFNSWGRDRFWDKNRGVTDQWVKADPKLALADVVKPIVIRNNRFQCDHGWDIDLDDGSSNYLIENNLCLTGGIKLREGFNRTVRNNIMVDNTFHPHVWYNQDDSDVFTGNIVFKAYHPIQLDGKGKLIDRNFFHKVAVSGQAFPEWDKNSISGDAQFKNSAKGDYRVAANSPALKMGFKNFPMNQFGVKSKRLRKMASNPLAYEAKKAAENGPRSNALITWGGLKLKNLNGLGELSAAGLDKERGVLIMPGSDPNLLNQLGLKEMDVILSFMGIRTDSVTEMFKALDKHGGGSIYTEVYRNQSAQHMKINFALLHGQKVKGLDK